MFEVSENARFFDGLQLTELEGQDPVFVFDAREEGTGRFHPPRLELNRDGSGRVSRAQIIYPPWNRFGSWPMGEEYITDLQLAGDLTPFEVEFRDIALDPSPDSGGGSVPFWLLAALGGGLIAKLRQIQKNQR